ncbi:RICIN domain-containing protein [Frankia sp. AiPs1]|uniref:RICIN domain-containing protein n=1 Tax=Frankia sp. AiPs1 TaxID=573493 RepID=UPI002044B6B3|nr:RICIN domain-containing protein [Frankia sp. AiPs1]MCM3921843.1 RICIN domain-containing protein [Frankia sp. AiPs1]
MTEIAPYLPEIRRDDTMCAFYKDLQAKVEEDAFAGDQVAQVIYIGATLGRWLACDVDAPVINEIMHVLGTVVRAIDEAYSWAQDKVTAAIKPHTYRGLIAKRLHNEMTETERAFAANASADFRQILDYVRKGKWTSEGVAIGNDYMYDDQLAEMKRAYRYGRTRAILERDMAAFRAEAGTTIRAALHGRPVDVDVDAVVAELFAQLDPDRLAWQSAFDSMPPAERLATIVDNEAKRLLGEVDFIPAAGGSYIITSEASGLPLMSDGTVVRQQNPAFYDWQQWTVVAVGGGLVELRARSSGKLLGESAGAAVATSTQGAQSRWWLGTSTGGYYELVAASGRALDVPGGATGTGVALVTHARNGSRNQRFRFTRYTPRAAGGVYALVSVASGQYVDVRDAATSSAVVQQFPGNGSTAQQWELVAGTKPSSFSLASRGGGLCLAYNGKFGGKQDHSVFTYTPGYDDQQWRIEPALHGAYRLVNVAHNRVLDLPGATSAPRTGLVGWGWNGANNQLWWVVPAASVHRRRALPQAEPPEVDTVSGLGGREREVRIGQRMAGGLRAVARRGGAPVPGAEIEFSVPVESGLHFADPPGPVTTVLAVTDAEGIATAVALVAGDRLGRVEVTVRAVYPGAQPAGYVIDVVP